MAWPAIGGSTNVGKKPFRPPTPTDAANGTKKKKTACNNGDPATASYVLRIGAEHGIAIVTTRSTRIRPTAYQDRPQNFMKIMTEKGCRSRRERTLARYPAGAGRETRRWPRRRDAFSDERGGKTGPPTNVMQRIGGQEVK